MTQYFCSLFRKPTSTATRKALAPQSGSYKNVLCERGIQLKFLLLVFVKLGGPAQEAGGREGFCIEGLLLQPVDTASKDFGLMKCCSF
tara:strand:- start:399 stop:662 length:264 start_codon:yes stop_codon:yes gene_type:complete